MLCFGPKKSLSSPRLELTSAGHGAVYQCVIQCDTTQLFRRPKAKPFLHYTYTRLHTTDFETVQKKYPLSKRIEMKLVLRWHNEENN